MCLWKYKDLHTTYDNKLLVFKLQKKKNRNAEKIFMISEIEDKPISIL